MNALKAARSEHKLTTTELAAQVGVTEQTIRRWEKQEDLSHMKVASLQKLSCILDKPISFFIVDNS